MELCNGALSWWKCHWRDLKSASLFRRISSWTPLKPHHCNPNPNPLANQLWCSDFLAPPTSLTDSLMPLKNWRSIHARRSKSSLKHYIRFRVIFFKVKTEFAYRSSKVSSRRDCIFEIHHLWQSGFSRVYSNCCCSCLLEPGVIKMVLSSQNTYSNSILNFQESTTILNACTKKSGSFLNAPHIYMYSSIR